MPIIAPLANTGCFGCGEANAIGLHLHFEKRPEGGVTARFSPRIEHQGWDGMMHGGLVTVLLDEAMAWAAAGKTTKYYTGRLSVRYRKPVPTAEALQVQGWIARDRGRALETEAQVLSDSGEVLAEASAVFIRENQPA